MNNLSIGEIVIDFLIIYFVVLIVITGLYFLGVLFEKFLKLKTKFSRYVLFKTKDYYIEKSFKFKVKYPITIIFVVTGFFLFSFLALNQIDPQIVFTAIVLYFVLGWFILKYIFDFMD